MSEWERVRLGDVMRQVKEPVAIKPGADYATMGIRYGVGAYALPLTGPLFDNAYAYVAENY